MNEQYEVGILSLTCIIHPNEERSTPGVMADRYSPFWDPGTYERSWVQAQWCGGETEAGPMPMSLSWGLPTACQVGSAMVLQLKN